jgi:hypothetical protein
MRRRIHAPYCVEGRLVCASLATISPAQDPYTVLYTRTGAQHSTLPTHTHTHTHTHTVLSLHIGFGGSTHILHTYYTYSSLGVQEGQRAKRQKGVRSAHAHRGRHGFECLC